MKLVTIICSFNIASGQDLQQAQVSSSVQVVVHWPISGPKLSQESDLAFDVFVVLTREETLANPFWLSRYPLCGRVGIFSKGRLLGWVPPPKSLPEVETNLDDVAQLKQMELVRGSVIGTKFRIPQGQATEVTNSPEGPEIRALGPGNYTVQAEFVGGNNRERAISEPVSVQVNATPNRPRSSLLVDMGRAEAFFQRVDGSKRILIHYFVNTQAVTQRLYNPFSSCLTQPPGFLLLVQRRDGDVQRIVEGGPFNVETRRRVPTQLECVLDVPPNGIVGRRTDLSTWGPGLLPVRIVYTQHFFYVPDSNQSATRNRWTYSQLKGYPVVESKWVGGQSSE